MLVAWRLDRLGRSLAEPVELVKQINAKGRGLR
jgi:DNA invertase Pin-like site-specific DNA recombinase